MVKRIGLLLFFCLNAAWLFAQKNKRIKGMYFQWGYNKEWYTNSNIHFKMGNGDNFTLWAAKAHDKPDLDAIYKKPIEISIPQYNYRLGFYLNQQHTKAFEINFDHIKYVVTDYQNVKISGIIKNQFIDGDSILNPNTFLHFEHTDGGNLLHFNYVQQSVLLKNKKTKQAKLNLIYKGGIGFNIPRTDINYFGEGLNNDFHIAGYNFAAEAGLKYYFYKNWFLEGTTKTGFVHYVNALANTKVLKGNRASHVFGYVELIGLIGFDIGLK
jgi:hypothetical protein